MKNHNSSELAAKAVQKLKLNKEKEMELYNALTQVPNGPVKDVLAALVEAVKPADMDTYVAVIRGSCVRDVQYSICTDAEPLDDEKWRDAEDVPIYVGMFEAETEIRARQIAAVREGVDTGVIEVYKV